MAEVKDSTKDLSCSIQGRSMNYEQAFLNLAKSHANGKIDPSVVGKQPDKQPAEVKLASVAEGFSSGSVAGQPSQRLLDSRDHFPVFTETQARSSMTRAMQLADVPVWYSGTLTDLRNEVFQGVSKAHPHLASAMNVSVPLAVALSDGNTPAETSKKKIDDPSDVVKTQVPSVKRPILTSAEIVAACENDETRRAIAGELMKCIEQKEADLQKAKKLATSLSKKGVSPEQFEALHTYLQTDILHALIYNEANASASVDDRRRALLDRLK